MARTSQPRKFWKIALAQIIFAVACSATLFYFRTMTFLAGPPSGDLYANNWGFQLVIFAIVWLPATLLFVGIALAIQRAWLTHNRRSGVGGSAP
jgi:hypothetical protein